MKISTYYNCTHKKSIQGIGVTLFVLFFGGLYPCNADADLIRDGVLSMDEHWTAADSPVLVDGDITIPAGISVQVEPGVDIQVNTGVSITVLGRLDMLGTKEEPITLLPRGEKRWGDISYEEQGTGTLRHCVLMRGSYHSDRIGVVNAYKCSAAVVIDSCTFSQWPDEFDAKATNALDSPNMVVRRCYFGEGVNEAVYGVNSPVLVEYNTFEARHDYRDAIDIGYTTNPGPIIRYNVFQGSEDDAIDLDECDAYVEGNLVMNCRGGVHDPIGISGDKNSRPILVNNVIINCESGIGFKNGADITVINNTIIDCDKGIWMHQNPAHARVINSIIWGREDQTSIQLEPGSTIDISYSVVRGDPVYLGEGNGNTDPLFVNPALFDFHLRSGSPAIGTGWLGDGVLDHDFAGQPRAGAIDIGAYEFQPVTSRVLKWMRF